MSGATQEEESSGSHGGAALNRTVIAEMLMSNFERLPDIERKVFSLGPLYLAGNAGLAGLVSNSLFRRALNVSQARLASNLPMAVLPFLTTSALYSAAVTQPLLSGDLNCPTCVFMRAALVGVLGGGVYPLLLALPLNIGLATRYSTTPMPEQGAMLRFCLDVSRPVWRRMRAVLLLQAVFGTYLGSRHFDTYTKLAQLTFQAEKEFLPD